MGYICVSFGPLRRPAGRRAYHEYEIAHMAWKCACVPSAAAAKDQLSDSLVACFSRSLFHSFLTYQKPSEFTAPRHETMWPYKTDRRDTVGVVHTG